MNRVLWYPGHELLLRNIVRAENCSLYDAEGNRYVDLESGVWCTAIGHGNVRILRVMAEQAARVAHTGYSYSSAIVAKAAEAILSLHGFDGGKCVFLCSGSEAVEFGVRMAQSVNAGPMLMTMADSSFGAYGSARERREEEWFCFDWMQCAGCQRPDACNGQCERWATIPFDRIGGFLFEPGSSSGLVRFPPQRLIRSIVSEVRAVGGLVLVNEVTTGVGRTGKWFGYQHYELSPDIVAMGKGIGNGYPVSVTAFASATIDRLGGRQIPYAQSHQNDSLGAAVALEVIHTINDGGLIERGRRIGAMLASKLEEIRARTGRIETIRARGLMVALELKDDTEASFTTHVRKGLLQNGYVVSQRPGMNVLRLDPSLSVENTDVENFLEIFEKVLVGNSN